MIHRQPVSLYIIF